MDEGSPRWRAPRGGAVSATLGGLWGLSGYAALWGYTPLVIHRPFVESVAGTLVLLPVKTVIFSIKLVEERVVGRSFDLSRTHGWIALAALAVGAALALGVFVAVRAALRRLR